MVTFKLSQQDITIGNELIYAFPTRPAMETLFLFIGTFEFINLIVMIAGVLGSRDDMEGGEKICLCIIPLFHVFGFFYTLSCIAAGSSMVVMLKFDFPELLLAIQQYRVKSLPATPPILVALNKSSIVSKYDLTSLHTIICGRAPLDKDMIDNFTARFPTLRVK
jgi:acyl-CoA synthetase (AMP-forming)/AMP-acid ligase II